MSAKGVSARAVVPSRSTSSAVGRCRVMLYLPRVSRDASLRAERVTPHALRSKTRVAANRLLLESPFDAAELGVGVIAVANLDLGRQHLAGAVLVVGQVDLTRV